MKRLAYMLVGAGGVPCATGGYDAAEGEWYRFALLLPIAFWMGWTFDRSERKP